MPDRPEDPAPQTADEPMEEPARGGVSDPDVEPDEHDESLIDEMRGSGVGVEDPNIVGDAEPGVVDDQVQKDTPPQV